MQSLQLLVNQNTGAEDLSAKAAKAAIKRFTSKMARYIRVTLLASFNSVGLDQKKKTLEQICKEKTFVCNYSLARKWTRLN